MKEILITIVQLFILIAGMCLFSWFDLFFTLHNILMVLTLGIVYVAVLFIIVLIKSLYKYIRGIRDERY